MCLIIYTKSGNIPKKHLKHALYTNDDGWGYMFHDGKELIVRKGMTPKEFWNQWVADYHLRQKTRVLFHARIGTHGTVTEANCHPFKVGKKKLYMMHNGIITQHNDPHRLKNDTRMFIEEIVEGLPNNWMEFDSIKKIIAHYVGYSKLAFMDGRGKVLIINKKLGTEDNGIWYSHHNYKPWGFGIQAKPKGAYFKEKEKELEEDPVLETEEDVEAAIEAEIAKEEAEYWKEWDLKKEEKEIKLPVIDMAHAMALPSPSFGSFKPKKPKCTVANCNLQHG